MYSPNKYYYNYELLIGYYIFNSFLITKDIFSVFREDETTYIINIQKAIADIQSNIILSEEVKKLEFTTLAKRAYVYSINNKIEDAIKDYNRALELRPGDIKIKENLAKLKAVER